MKPIGMGLAAIIGLATLSCQREESPATEKRGTADPAGQSRGNGAPAMDAAPESSAAPTKPTKAAERPPTKVKTIPVAEPIPGQPGMVKSPFNGKIIDVKGIPSGTLVADPTYPADQQKHFRIPEPIEGEEVPPTEDEVMDEQAKLDAPEAHAVPGRAGFVFSPYDNKIVDVSGLEPGVVVADPGAPPGENRYFKVPGTAETDDGPSPAE